MNMRLSRLLLIACGFFASTAGAADLRVTPVTIEPLAGARTTTLTLINEESRPIHVQIRVMRWTQVKGEDVLSLTNDVVVSPPFASLDPKQHYLVRLVRTAQTPIAAEESYRVLVDEIPSPGETKPGTVNLVLRQSIPAFFSDKAQRAHKADWNVVHDGKGLWLEVNNPGTRRLRLADINVITGGKSVYQHPGLVGYVLAGSRMRWPIQLATPLPDGTALLVKAATDTGPAEVSLVARKSP